MEKEQKQYVPRSSAKAVTFAGGKSILKLGFHVESFVAFLQANVNEKGYVNLGVSERFKVGERGDTHCVWLDTWKPGQTKPNTNKPMNPEAVQAGLSALKSAVKTETDNSDVPF